MKNYLYIATTGHTIISPVNLDYAQNITNLIDPSRIRADDFRKIQLLTDTNTAKCVQFLLEKDIWPDADTVIDQASVPSRHWEHNWCISRNSETYIRNGKQYEPLDRFIDSCDKDALSLALKLVSTQAAQCYNTNVMLMHKYVNTAE